MMNKFIVQGKVKQLDATILSPQNSGLRFILNACGQSGKFDSKLGSALTKRWSKVREDYKGWHATQHNFKMGWLNNTAVSSDTWVVNMLVEGKDGKLDLDALRLAVKKLTDLAKYEHASLHISSMLLEDVPELNSMLVKSFAEEGINVYIYNEPTK